jgi:hypothetical protein
VSPGHRSRQPGVGKKLPVSVSLALITILLVFVVITHVRESRQRASTRSFACYRVTVDGEPIPVVDIKPCPRNSTLDGMRTTLRELSKELRLPKTPKPLLAQPGLGATICSERRHFARTAGLSGKDLVICADMSDRFKWPWESADLRMVRIDEQTSRRLERLVVAIRQEWGCTPDAILESQATRLIVPGTLGSVTLADLSAKGKLDSDFRLNRVVCVAVPLRGCGIDKTLRRRMGDVLSFTTPSPTGFVAGEPLVGEPHVEIRLRNGDPVRHKYLFAERLPDGSVNPIPNLTTMFLTGSPTWALQTQADRRAKH